MSKLFDVIKGFAERDADMIRRLEKSGIDSQLRRIQEYLKKNNPMYHRSTEEGKKVWDNIYIKKDNEGTLEKKEIPDTRTEQEKEDALWNAWYSRNYGSKGRDIVNDDGQIIGTIDDDLRP